MQQWLIHLADTAPYAPYLVLVGLMFLTGFGLPLPEDLPIILGGYFAATLNSIDWAIMLVALFVALMGADGFVFWMGRRYGHHVPKLPLLNRYLTEKRLAKAEKLLHKHGGKFVFVARFLPGLRTPAILTAGIFKLPYWKLLLYDGSAAMISVPTIFFVAYFFAAELNQVFKWVKEGQLAVIGVIVVVIALLIAGKMLFKRKLASAGN